MARGLPQKRQIPGVSSVILVSSAKGGVGKSTTSVNLSLGLQHHGKRVGLLDADVFGPSIPTMMNLDGEPLIKDGKLVPLINYGIKTMSMGYLVKPEDAVVWRGMMVMKAIQQLVWETDWGDLDVLVVDLPPGTGDVTLSIVQQVIVSGAIIVTTPQDVARADVVRGIEMFKKTKTPILGVVENMSMYCCPNCGHESRLFGKGKPIQGFPLLAEMPLEPVITEMSDRGTPVVISRPDSVPAQRYRDLAKTVLSLHQE
ncbi:iron-sulfur protein IND1 [Gorgonomyces haynaldii]|nr:iron-sulfur protein IND1 [Gorgonomyces haynaldii]